MYKFNSPDSLLIDIIMPKLNGVEALKEIMNIDSMEKFIMCSVLGQQHLNINSLKIGAKDFVVKPHFENLVSIVNKYI